jgi:hypothetical protein
VTLQLAQPPEGVFNQSGQLTCSVVDGLVQGRGLVRDRDGLAAFETGFHHATHGVMAALFVTVFVAQVDLHSCDVIGESTQGTFHYATDLSGERLVNFDVVTGVYLDLHGVFLL